MAEIKGMLDNLRLSHGYGVSGTLTGEAPLDQEAWAWLTEIAKPEVEAASADFPGFMLRFPAGTQSTQVRQFMEMVLAVMVSEEESAREY